MALVTFNRTELTEKNVRKILTDNGFISLADAPFLGSIVNTLKAAIDIDFEKIYKISDNVDIGRAEGEYLSRWSDFLDESIEAPSYAMDLSLSNVSISLDPEVNAGELTSDGTGITIPKDTLITDDNGLIEVRTLDEIYIRPDRNKAYTRVIATRTGKIYIPIGILSNVDYSLSLVSNILPAVINSYSLSANNIEEISGGNNVASESTFRYILQQKAKSIGLFNENRVNTLLDIEDVISVMIQEYTGGVNIYIDTSNKEVTNIIVENARALMHGNKSLGQSVQLYPPIDKRLKIRIQMEVKNSDYLVSSQNTFKTDLSNALNDFKMGDSIPIKDITKDISDADSNIVGTRILEMSCEGRILVSAFLQLAFNERLIISGEDITIV